MNGLPGREPVSVRTMVLGGVVALNAAGAMIVEIVAGRLLAPYFGMSLYTWTTVIGVVLAGLTLGHWLGGRWAVRPGDESAATGADWIGRRIGWALWGGAVTTILILPLVSLVAGALLQAEAAPALAITICGFAVFFLPSVVAGLVQPMATVAALGGRSGEATGRIIGMMLACGAAGSILGTFAAGFVLISWLGSAATLWLVAAGNAVLALMFVPGRRTRGAIGGVLAVGAGALMWSGGSVPGFATPCEVESDYYCIRIDDASGQTGRASRLMALDHLVHSVNDAADPQMLFSPYLHLVDEFARARYGSEPVSAFFVGGGGFTLPRAWQGRNPKSRLVVAEVDPVVTRLARQEMWFSPGAETTVVERDARMSLREQPANRRFDVVFGDAFHDIAMPPHLVSDEFNALVADRLTETGFYALNVIDNPARPRLLASVLRTLGQRFPVLEVWVEPRSVRGARRATFILYASTVASGLGATHRAVYGYPHVWAKVALSSLPIESEGILLTDDFAPVDRLLADLWTGGD